MVTPKDNNDPCISVPPLLATTGQVSSLESCPPTLEPDDADGRSAMTMTPRDPPTSTATTDPEASSSEMLPEDVTTHNDAVPLECPTPVPVSDTLPVSPTSFSFSHAEEIAEEEDQFDDAEVPKVDEPPKLHPSEQPLPSSPSPSPSPSPSSLSLVDRMVKHILQKKPQVSEANMRSETTDEVITAVSPTGVPPYSPVQDHDDVSSMDTSAQEGLPNVLDPSGCDGPPAELPPLKYIPLPLNAG